MIRNFNINTSLVLNSSIITDQKAWDTGGSMPILRQLEKGVVSIRGSPQASMSTITPELPVRWHISQRDNDLKDENYTGRVGIQSHYTKLLQMENVPNF